MIVTTPDLVIGASPKTGQPSCLSSSRYLLISFKSEHGAKIAKAMRAIYTAPTVAVTDLFEAFSSEWAGTYPDNCGRGSPDPIFAPLLRGR